MFEVFEDIDPKYESLVEVLKMAYERAAVGKGHAHHSRGEPFEEQWICRGTRIFGLGGPLFQIGKKIEQVEKMSNPGEKINELLDVINYSAACVLILLEELAKEGR